MKKIDGSKKTFNKIFSNQQKGFTMIELLIVISILGLILVALFFLTFKQVSRGRDGKRKADLEKIKIAFEDYYNDNECYPDPADAVLDACNQTTFKPYLDIIPCDPKDKQPYIYVPADSGPCDGYKVLARLENADDPSIMEAGCDPQMGCGYDDSTYNYGIAVGTPIGGSGAFGGGSYPGSTPEYDDDWYCTVEIGCSILSRRNAEERSCQKLYEYSGANPPQECVDECNPSAPEYASVVCQPE